MRLVQKVDSDLSPFSTNAKDNVGIEINTIKERLSREILIPLIKI